MGRMEDQSFPDNGRAPWMLFADRLDFPVEWSLSGHPDTGRADDRLGRVLPTALRADRPATTPNTARPHHRRSGARIRQAVSIYDEVTEGDEETSTRFVGVIRLAVAADTVEECLDRARTVTDLYGSRQRMTWHHPRGQTGLLREFIPGEPAAPARLPADHAARLPRRGHAQRVRLRRDAHRRVPRLHVRRGAAGGAHRLALPDGTPQRLRAS